MRAKLTTTQFEEIRQRYQAGGVSQATLADEYGVGQTCISKIVRGDVGTKNRLGAEGKRRCYRCDTVKPLEDFTPNRSKPSGYGALCHVCTSAENAARHAANPEPGRVRATRWSCENSERRREIGRKGRATRRARLAEAFVEEVDPQVLYERDEGVCGVCGEPVARDEFEVDHIVQLAHGGEHSYANTRIAHVSCNRRRNRRRTDQLVEVK